MNVLTKAQIIRDEAGNPAFAVIPYNYYVALENKPRVESYVPDEVVRRVIQENMTPIRAWREYLKLTQAYVAEKLGVSQSAYAQQENKKKLRKSSRKKIAAALKIDEQQIDF